MSFENFKKLIDQLPTLKRVNLFWMGETLLNKDIFRMVDYAAEKGIASFISTNSTTLINDYKKLQESKLRLLEVCLDGFTQETMGKYRKGINAQKVLDGISKLMDNRTNYEMVIWLRALAFKHNEHEISEIIDFAKQNKFDKLTVGKAILRSSPISTKITDSIAEEWLPKNKIFQRYKKTKSGYVIKGRLSYCPAVWHPIITWDGRLAPCCYDFDNDFGTSNSVFEDFYGVYLSEEARKIRENMIKMKFPICKECPEVGFADHDYVVFDKGKIDKAKGSKAIKLNNLDKCYPNCR
jgi:MoaA/NifB/PqqE/SkfB family radical SAM enzyme